MYTKLLVPLDGSSFAESALPAALSIAGRTGGTIELATVREPLTAMVYQEWMGPDGGWEEPYLEVVIRRFSQASEVELTGQVLSGRIAQALEEHVDEVGADLVVMATHGRGPLSRAWLGSVADSVIRRSTTPILLVRPEEDGEAERDVKELETEFSRILIPLDGSDLSETILEPAVALGRLFDASYTLVRVVHYPAGLASPYLPDTVTLNQQLVDEAKDRARAYLAGVAEGLREEGLQVETRVTVEPQPANGIVGLVREDGFDLIAMATHGRGGVSRALLGSVADKVLRGADTPTLVVRPPEESTSK